LRQPLARRQDCLFQGGLRKSGAGAPATNLIWERHYRDHRIADEADYVRLVDYVHGNPMRHGLCADAAEWQWSSLHRFVAAGFAPPAMPLAPPPWMRPGAPALHLHP
jgi:putative transposase